MGLLCFPHSVNWVLLSSLLFLSSFVGGVEGPGMVLHLGTAFFFLWNMTYARGLIVFIFAAYGHDFICYLITFSSSSFDGNSNFLLP